MDIGQAEVALEAGTDPFERLIPRAITALGLWKETPAIELADKQAELVIDPYRGTVHLRGTHLSAIDGLSMPFKFLTLLAAANGRVVLSGDMIDALGGRPDAAKDAAKRTRDAIKLSFKKAGLLAPAVGEIICSGSGGYALRTPCFVS